MAAALICTVGHIVTSGVYLLKRLPMAGPVNVDDVTSQWCQCRRGIRRESLDRQAGHKGWRRS